MEIDKKRELYQHYKKLEDRFESKKIKVGIYKLFLGVIFFITFTTGLTSIPFISNLGWFNQNNFEKFDCQLDSIHVQTFGRRNPSYFVYMIRNRDAKLSVEERKKRIVFLRDFPNFYEYLGKEPDTLPMEQSPILDSIPLWVNKNSGDAYFVQKHSPDKIDFMKYNKTKFLLVFIFSFPLLIFFIKFVKKNDIQKENLKKEVSKAHQEWENYSSYK